MQLRGTLLKALIALALTATCAAEASADSPCRWEQIKNRTPSVEAQTPALPVDDTMTEYQGRTVGDISWPDVSSEVDQRRWRELIPQKVGEAA